MARSAVALGGTVFAALMLIVAGTWQALVGIAAITKGEFFVAGAGYAYEFDTTGWGWVHLIIGALAVVIGFSLFTGAGWARVLALAITVGSLISNFMWLPFQPWWSIMVIAADVFIIWSLVNVGDMLRSSDQREA